MSIWCSHPSVGYDEYRDPFDGPNPRGQVLTYAVGFSNHYPEVGGDEERPAEVAIASIAPWCVPGHLKHDDETYVCECGENYAHNNATGTWLRLDLDAKADRNGNPVNASVVMDEAAVTALIADLSAWLARPKARVR